MGCVRVGSNMHIRVLQSGGSSGSVRLNVPKDALDELELEGGDSIAISVDSDSKKVELQSCDELGR